MKSLSYLVEGMEILLADDNSRLKNGPTIHNSYVFSLKGEAQMQKEW